MYFPIIFPSFPPVFHPPRLNIPDEVDADSALTSAVDEVEAKIGKPLTFGDEKGLGLWRKATESILEKWGKLGEN